ncbi:MAG: hypothetical protein U9R47_04600, partial [Actinomycetota bacterium]|nr:hypothetical protein [Actinomycetota bacterium]
MSRDITPTMAAVIEARSLLGEPQIVKRLCGIGSLCRIAETEKEFRHIVGKILAEFIRERVPWNPLFRRRHNPPEDVQRALDILGRWCVDERGPLDLSGT